MFIKHHTVNDSTHTGPSLFKFESFYQCNPPEATETLDLFTLSTRRKMPF